MILRIVRAYGGTAAVVGSIVLIAAGLVLVNRAVGLTRQPLPLVWPLAVMHILLAQVPLGEILGPAERLSDRRVVVRSIQALASLASVAAGALTYVASRGDHGFMVFFLCLAGAGFVAAAVAGPLAWSWTLGLGMSVVRLQFITPLAPASRYLAQVPQIAAIAVMVLAACFYVMDRGLRPRIS